jgi:hypothetical protein
MKELLHNEIFIFYAILAICFVIMYIPVIGKYIRVLETMIHEGGHVLMALLTGTKIKKINLFSNTSGETHIASAATFRTILIGLMGYPFSSLMAWVAFWAITNHYYQIFIIVLCVITLLFLVFFIRNGFGVFWAISFILINGYLVYANKFTIIKILSVIYADILFLSSLSSCFIIVYLAFKYPNKAGDATLINKVTHIPSQIVAVFFLIVCSGVALMTVKDFFPFLNNVLTNFFNKI